MPRKNRTNTQLKDNRRREMRRRRNSRAQRLPDGISDGFAYEEGSTGETGESKPLAGRILGIDFGERRIGLALSDPAGLIAQGLETKVSESPEDTLSCIAEIVEAEQVREIVLGLPYNMDGTTGEMAEKVEAFAGLLRDRVSCGIRTWDERLTSVSAQRAMSEMGLNTRKDKGSLDRIAATMLLQNYLDFRRRATDETGFRT